MTHHLRTAHFMSLSYVRQQLDRWVYAGKSTDTRAHVDADTCEGMPLRQRASRVKHTPTNFGRKAPSKPVAFDLTRSPKHSIPRASFRFPADPKNLAEQLEMSFWREQQLGNIVAAQLRERWRVGNYLCKLSELFKRCQSIKLGRAVFLFPL